MEERRFKDIVAFKWHDGPRLAFHARALELADISDDAWDLLLLIDKPSSNSQAAKAEIERWESEENPEVKSQIILGIRKLVLNVTQICNLKCTYCAAGGDGTYGAAQLKINVEKTLPQLKYFLDRVPAGENFQINFLGGEPLLFPDGIKEIGNYVGLMSAERDIKCSFSLVTNGTLINEKILRILCDLKMNITVSMDGPPETNDKTRPQKDGRGSTNLVLEGLRKLAAHKKELGSLSIQGVFNTENLEILTAYKFYRTLNVDRYEFSYDVEESDAKSNLQFLSQMNLIAKYAYQNGGENELRKIGIFNQYFSALDMQQRSENHCGAGKSFLMIDALNNLFTCPWDINDKKEQVGAMTTLYNEQMTAYSGSLIDKNSCQSCWARYLCGGGCMFVHKQSSGSKHIKDDQFCFRTRGLVTTALLYYKLCRETC